MSSTAEPPQQYGNENRSSILPVISPLSSPAANYNPSDELPAPNEIGIYREGSMSQVIQSVRGLGYYVDMIGFGEQSTPFSLPGSFPIGNNYFMKTGMTCDNGADMWYYVQGIPEGSAFGKRVQGAIAAMGLPKLRGLAPGIVEDAKDALDIKPIMGAVFGKGYPRCRLAKLPVGDARGRIKNENGEYYIEDPGSARKEGDMWVQEKWIQETNAKGEPIFIDSNTYKCTPKNRTPGGKKIPDYAVPALDTSCSAAEGFEGLWNEEVGVKASKVLALVFGAALLGTLIYRKTLYV